ncbi:uncharacterized protein K444DRAFT_606226 [Hyaloscypha bicolor E]|uniref:Uncharacterized protein n=1 Tax=Hyaloscypha bicolor E TaxID=1095630 RepID=A0A2J6TWC0_9HELO|nr:uncharacterized protein K444DRAFT_606226 [Hyaloscypha bicolor E]PMD67297.1 hypothetical protein K444DRAFT_606226 [Hyaloscypha bicolor E]
MRDAYEPPVIFLPQSAVCGGIQRGRQGFASKRFKGRFDHCDRVNRDSMNIARAPKQVFHCHRRCSSSNTAGLWHIVLSRP